MKNKKKNSKIHELLMSEKGTISIEEALVKSLNDIKTGKIRRVA